MLPYGDSAVSLDAGAAANLVRFRWLAHHSRLQGREECRQVSTYPLSARFRFGNGRLGEVRRAADVPVGFAWGQSIFSAFALDSDIRALLRKDVLEAPGGPADFPRDLLIFLERGLALPLRVNRAGHCLLSVVDSRKDESMKVRGPVVSASYFG